MILKISSGLNKIFILNLKKPLVLDRASSGSMLTRARSENWYSNLIDARSSIVLDWASIYSVFAHSCWENWCSKSLNARKIDACSNTKNHVIGKYVILTILVPPIIPISRKCNINFFISNFQLLRRNSVNTKKTKTTKMCRMEFTLGIYGHGIEPIKICKNVTSTKSPDLTPVRM